MPANILQFVIACKTKAQDPLIIKKIIEVLFRSVLLLNINQYEKFSH